jgi:hypothetical protein
MLDQPRSDLATSIKPSADRDPQRAESSTVDASLLRTYVPR